jgi:fibronectin-binding autotransporter adhesin
MMKRCCIGLTILACAHTLHAEPLTWNGGDPSGTWQDGAGGWLDVATPVVWDNEALYSALFSGTAPAAVDVHEDGVTVDDLFFAGVTAYELNGGGITLGNGTLNAEAGATHSIRSSLISTNGFTKTGDGVVWLRSSADTLSGPVTIEAGTLGLFHANAIGSGDILVEGGGTLNPRTLITLNNKITVDTSNGQTATLSSVAWGDGPDFAGDITLIGNGLTRIWGVSSKIVTGDITSESGTGELRFMADNGRLVDVSGSLDLGTRKMTMTGAGGSTIIRSTGNTWGLTEIGRGIQLLGTTDALATGAGLHFAATQGWGALDLAGYNQSVAHLSGVAATNRITNSEADTTSTLTVGSDNTSTTFGGFIEDGAGTVALTKTGVGTLTLTGTNTYTGATQIQSGTVVLGATGRLNGTEEIQLSAGATLNVTNVAGGLILGSHQTLSGYGTVIGDTTIEGILSPGNSVGTLTMDNLTLADGATLIWDYVNTSTYDRLETTDGTMTLPEGGTLYLTIRGLTVEPGFAIEEGHTFTIWNGEVANFDLATIQIDDSQSGWAHGWEVTTGESLVLTAIPEPSALSLIAVMIAVGCALRRRS